MARASHPMPPGPAAKLDEVEWRLVEWIARRRDAMVALLESVVNIDSGSSDKPGVNAVADCFRRFLEERGVAAATIADGAGGDILGASGGGDAGVGFAQLGTMRERVGLGFLERGE